MKFGKSFVEVISHHQLQSYDDSLSLVGRQVKAHNIRTTKVQCKQVTDLIIKPRNPNS